MGVVRTIGSKGRAHREFVQTYRWDGKVVRKSLPFPPGASQDLGKYQAKLDQLIWDSTYLPLFDSIREAALSRASGSPKSLVEKEQEEFVQEFTYNTNRIEGSTLTLNDTRLLLEREVVPNARPLRDILETRAHASLVRSLLANPEPIDLAHILRWHQSLFRETKPDIAGQLRGVQVWIRGSKHVPPSPLEVRPMLIELLRYAGRARARVHPVQLAAEFHFRFENVHPFADGNGRVGRLAMNILLRQAGYPMLDILYTKRLGYYAALEKSSIGSTARPFIHWFFLRYARAHRRLLPKSALA
jgi:Fic family protein